MQKTLPINKCFILCFSIDCQTCSAAVTGWWTCKISEPGEHLLLRAEPPQNPSGWLESGVDPGTLQPGGAQLRVSLHAAPRPRPSVLRGKLARTRQVYSVLFETLFKYPCDGVKTTISIAVFPQSCDETFVIKFTKKHKEKVFSSIIQDNNNVKCIYFVSLLGCGIIVISLLMLTHSHWSLYIINVCACKYKIITNCCFNYWTLGFLPQKVLEQRDLTARSLELAAAAAIWRRENLVCSQHTGRGDIVIYSYTAWRSFAGFLKRFLNSTVSKYSVSK